ncbi:glycosyltransferase family protein [Primorskyibacter sp. S87]|uniref:glycosyltransferase family protein n=1 Tax=Primorskyibacter sp. S87 TaxID=3415126 RepID=UPI003C7AA1B4
MKVLIAVTHLLGTGHLSRALTLGRAFAAQDHEILVVSGGMPAPQLNSNGLDILNLPPLRSDGTNFTRLLTECGSLADAAYLEARRIGMVSAVKSFAPDILITELYPFGRRVLREEFLSLLQAAHQQPRPPLILSSIRDILAPPSKPEKAVVTDTVLEQYYDGVLVHSDPTATRLQASWPVSEKLERKLHYTGYVAPVPVGPHPEKLGKNEIVVSAGGGSVGGPIFHAAINAATKISDRRWRLLVGGSDAPKRIKELQQIAGDAPVLIERIRPDFRQMLNHCAASVSMCGYNTMLDLLQAGTPAVLIPFDDGQEVEQGLRAAALSHMPQFAVLKSSELTGDGLARTIETLLASGRSPAPALQFDGAIRSVEIAVTLREATA